MTIVRWEPFRELSSLQTEVNRLFNSVVEAPAATAGAGAPRRWTPAMDLLEDDEAFILRADLPGMRQEDVNIEIEDSTLTVSGERRSESEHHEGSYHRVERAFGSFSRSLTLPKGVDADAVTAKFADGVLEVRIPKPEMARPRRVEITAGDAPATIEG
jgi:HSP20 family protein